MSDHSFKVSKPGKDANSQKLQDLVVDGKYPHWKCDLRPTPKHFGLVKATVNLNNETKTVFEIDHGYGYLPSFICSWYAPGNKDFDGTPGVTYGIGSLEYYTGSLIVNFNITLTDTKLTIVATNYDPFPSGDVYAEFRYYIFADRFKVYRTYPVDIESATSRETY